MTDACDRSFSSVICKQIILQTAPGLSLPPPPCAEWASDSILQLKSEIYKLLSQMDIPNTRR